MVNANNGWAVTHFGEIIHWDGSNWTFAPSPTTSPLYSVFMISDDYGWAVGNYGTIILWNGIDWVPELSSLIVLPTFLTATLTAVAVCIKKIYHT